MQEKTLMSKRQIPRMYSVKKLYIIGTRSFLGRTKLIVNVHHYRNVPEQSIVDYVADRVAPHKKLGAGVMFVETLPKNQTGKILRRELKAQVFKGSFGY